MYNDKKNCAGTYPVKGYKRSDGTEVSSYMRTCGAKHEGDYGAMTGGASNIEDSIDKARKEFQYYTSLAPSQGTFEMFSSSDKAYHKYYKLSLDFDYYKQFDKDNSYSKYGFLKNSDEGIFIKQHLGIKNLNDNTDVVIPQIKSRLANAINNSLELKNVLSEHLAGIKNGKYKNGSIGINFNQTAEVHLTIGNAILYNMQIVDGCVCGTLIDYYDFKKLKLGEDGFLNVIVNNNAYLQQETGRLRNYLIIMPIRIPLSDLK